MSLQTYFVNAARKLEMQEDHTSFVGKESSSPEIPGLTSGDKGRTIASRTKRDIDLGKRLWRSVQSAIMSVTESYSSTYRLNTVVSDLMALTKVVSESEAPVPLQRAATISLIQLLAPIAPATAEECWARLNLPNNPNERILGSKAVNPTAIPEGRLTKSMTLTARFDLRPPVPGNRRDARSPSARDPDLCRTGEREDEIHDRDRHPRGAPGGQGARVLDRERDIGNGRRREEAGRRYGREEGEEGHSRPRGEDGELCDVACSIVYDTPLRIQSLPSSGV